jgi:putative endonuclease
MYYVYVIFSPNHNVYYKGFTEDVKRRLNEHNSDMSTYSSNKGPWELVVVEMYQSKQMALKREKSLKKCKKNYFIWLSKQSSNIVNDFR